MKYKIISSWSLILLIHALSSRILLAQSHEEFLFPKAVTPYQLTETNINTHKQVRASFTTDVRDGEGRLTVAFTNQSQARYTRIRYFEWDFDNDGMIDATQANPVYTFEKPGVYSVRLTVSDGDMTHTVLSENLITLAPAGHTHRFSGFEDWIEVAQQMPMNDGDFTLETWLKARTEDQGRHPVLLSSRTPTGEGLLFGFHDNWGNVTHKIPFVELNHYNYINYENPPNLLDGRWHHFAVVRKHRQLTYYFDGQAAAQCLIRASAAGHSGGGFCIGGDRFLPTDTTFKGALKNLRLWNQARTVEQLRAEMGRNIPKTDSGLIFQLDEQTISLAPDRPVLEGRSFSAHIPTTALGR